jgi:hypothetical protein
MKPTLAPGVSAVNRFVVDKAKTIGFMGEEGRVYATPFLIGDIEVTCRNLILAQRRRAARRVLDRDGSIR